ncbi:MAG: multicopper oxidase family protein [Hyphomicrobiaceae bacterium]
MIRKIPRRAVLQGLAASLGLTTLRAGVPGTARANDAAILTARAGAVPLRGNKEPPTPIWGYNGQAPGPVLRVRQGEELQVRLVNQLQQPTSLHWHGIRIANAMDGVPGMTQEAVQPGEHFDYQFICPDAGTFWYHPHILSSEQVARGLHGILIVEEPDPPEVDQDLVFVVDDWRLTENGTIHAASFGAIGERAHGGRYGNTFTLNGVTSHKIDAKAGQRVRLRLCNVSNANIFGVKIDDHAMRIIAIDGQPVKPFEAENGFVVLASGQRSDVVIDMTGEPGATSLIKLLTYDNQYTIGEIVYHATERARPGVLDAPYALPANPLDTNLDLANAHTEKLMMDGGAMGGMTGAWVGNKWLDMRELIDTHGLVWSFNGAAGMPKEPLFKVPKGRTVKLQMVNRTRWPHAMHLHGHHFKQITREPKGFEEPFWRDTILLNPRENFTMAFVADNPGKWMLHCHMLEHQEGGMATWFEVEA